MVYLCEANSTHTVNWAQRSVYVTLLVKTNALLLIQRQYQLCTFCLPTSKATVLSDKSNYAICKNTNQYGEPINDFLLANVAVI